jgi:hypothetical protein
VRRTVLINAQIAAALTRRSQQHFGCPKKHSPLSSIRRTIQCRGHSCADPAVKPLFGSKPTLSDRFSTPALISQRAGGMAHVSQIEFGWHRLRGGMLADAYTPDGRFSRC